MEFVNDKTADGDFIYPEIDDTDVLNEGDVVFISTTLTKDDETVAKFAVPGTVFTNGEGKIAVKP